MEFPVFCLKHQFKSNLNISWIVAGTVDLAEVGCIKVLLDVPRSAIGRVIESIEEVGAKFGVHPLGAKLLPDTEVEILRRRLAKVIETLRFVAK